MTSIVLLTYPAPGNVGLDEQCPPEAPKDPQQDERTQLHQVPRGMKLHIKQHKTAVSKGVDGAQSEGGDQSSEERTPEGLQREVITHLEGGDGGGVIKNQSHSKQQREIYFPLPK